ncbi:hypothetical protein MF271_22580 (plasmid) [Deinococcus sp. KNUC1210]|uniref:hypothetical protein n=1 Tax=Deinococcus sp. KNUC1210 TaxID=2917691 RepID=UPI001EF01494|nr:hypothetical protein [Deinococcus sp. KNUC1210]ULH18255.1 hypothetical protein MF271_22580 [Deinococcus sp. KNUC1210]
MPPQVPLPSLNASIEHLYRVFERYPLQRHIDGCTCGCLPLNADVILHATPLHTLTHQALHRFALKTMTTWGNEADFKHFLPRLLELLTQEAFGDVHLLMGKLAYGHWWSWPDSEYQAVQAFLQAWWDSLLRHEDEDIAEWWNGSEVVSALEGIAQAERDLTPYLRQWDELETPSAVQQLAVFVLSNAEALVRGQLSGVSWEHRTPQALQVVHWLLTGQQQARLEAAARDQRHQPQREMLERAASTLSVVAS